MKNKKGSIPIIILVLGVLAVCSLALLSFYISNFKVENSFSRLKIVEQMNCQIESNLYEGKSIDNLYLEDKIKRPSLNFKEGFLKEKIVFSVTYNPLS